MESDWASYLQGRYLKQGAVVEAEHSRLFLNIVVVVTPVVVFLPDLRFCRYKWINCIVVVHLVFERYLMRNVCLRRNQRK